MDENQAIDLFLEMVQRRATEALALPAAEREARYKLIKDSAYDTAKKSLGLSESKSEELGSKVDESVRALVDIIERSGGASGGTA